MPKPVEGTSRYVPGIDGLRAVAVLAVIVYHLSTGWLPGGLLGVGVFFVISGYLITDLLVAERRRSGRIALRHFWARRARRLLPALFLMLFVVVGWVTLVDPGRLAELRSDLPAALFYYSNWWYVFHHVSYFAKFGPPSPLGHLWSLAVEEQFYLVWPLLLIAILRVFRSNRARITVVLAAACASAVEMGLLYAPGSDPTRVYDSTDTRAFGLLIGAALALAWPRSRVVHPIDKSARRILEVVGGSALAGILAMYALTGEYDTFLYRGGMVLLSVLTAVVIAVVAHPGARLRNLLGWGPLRWIGERSYGIYLWHYPVIVLTTPLYARTNVLRVVLQVAASILLAALSWHFVEEPIRHGALSRLAARVRSREWTLPKLPPIGWAVLAAAAANCVVVAAGLADLFPTPVAEPASQVTTVLPPTSLPAVTTTVPSSRGTGSGRPARISVPARGPVPYPMSSNPPRSASSGGPAPTPPTAAPPPPGDEVTAIGDSLMIDATPYLEKLLPGIAIDGKIGQQLWQVQDAMPQLKAEGMIRKRVIIELGTNGPYTPAQLVALLRSLGPTERIVLVNTRVPDPWEQEVNETIAQVAKTFPHTTMVNWYALSADHLGWFYPDGVHLDPEGASYYASLMARAVESN